MEMLKKQIERLQKQLKPVDFENYTNETLNHYTFNKAIEKEILRTKIRYHLKISASNEHITELKEKLSEPCVMVDELLCVVENENVLTVKEENANNHKYLFFFSDDKKAFRDIVIQEILLFYTKKAKEENMNSVVLHYENLNNCLIRTDLEKLGFVRHEQDSEKFGASFMFVNEAPEIFYDHLPRGFYIQELKEDVVVSEMVKILEVLENFTNIESDFHDLKDGIEIIKDEKQFDLFFSLTSDSTVVELKEWDDKEYKFKIITQEQIRFQSKRENIKETLETIFLQVFR